VYAGRLESDCATSVLPSDHGNAVSRKGHAVPGALPWPDSFVPETSKSIHGKGFLLCLELSPELGFLKALVLSSLSLDQPRCDVPLAFANHEFVAFAYA
jgi:hypothetical protein